MPTPNKRNYLFLVVGVMLALCLATSAVCVASQSFMTDLPLPFGYLMSVCGVFRTQPPVQMGLMWGSPLFSATFPPYGGPANGCYIIPWLPVLPQSGSLALP